MGYVGNNGTLDTDYATSIANRTVVEPTTNPGAFRFGRSYGGTTANFDLSGERITSYGQGGVAGGYTIRQGDTLETIAAQLWGDSTLWYKLAEANGMSSPNGLSEGQRLTIPAGVMRSHHNATTFKPFDPSETIGDISPTTPTPQKAAKRGNKCGVFGIILLVAIAVAVTVVTSGALAAASISAVSGTSVTLGAGIAALGGAAAAGTTVGLTTIGMIAVGAAGAAAGSIVSQAFGVATGIQDKFSWKAVAMAGIAGGVGGGLGSVMKGAGILMSAARGAAGSAISQGIGVAVGLQKKFDFAGVAAAGLAGGVGARVGKALGAGSLSDLSARNIGANLATSTAGAIANATVRTLINGSDFGDNMLAALPDIIGSTIGNMLAFGISGGNRGPGSAESPGSTAQNQPASGEGGDQVGNAEGEGDIIVTARRPASDSGYVDYFPAATAMLFDYDVNTGGFQYAVERRRQRVVQDLAGQASSATSAAPTGYAAVDAIDGSMDGTPDVGGWAASEFELRVRTARLEAAYAAGDFDANVYAAVRESLAVNADLLVQWNAIADAEVGKLLFAGIGAPMAIGGGLATLPVLAAGGVSLTGWIGGGITLDYAQSAGRGLLNGSFQPQGTVGGTTVGYLTNGRYGEGAYALGSLGVAGLSGIIRGGTSIGTDIGVASSRYSLTAPTITAARGTVNTTLDSGIGILVLASRGKGNFGLGAASAQEAIRLGHAWVGSGFTAARNGKALVSADGLRQFRPPSMKPRLGIAQANFEQRFVPSGRWQSNGHLDIVP